MFGGYLYPSKWYWLYLFLSFGKKFLLFLFFFSIRSFLFSFFFPTTIPLDTVGLLAEVNGVFIYQVEITNRIRGPFVWDRVFFSRPVIYSVDAKDEQHTYMTGLCVWRVWKTTSRLTPVDSKTASQFEIVFRSLAPYNIEKTKVGDTWGDILETKTALSFSGPNPALNWPITACESSKRRKYLASYLKA